MTESSSRPSSTNDRSCNRTQASRFAPRSNTARSAIVSAHERSFPRASHRRYGAPERSSDPQRRPPGFRRAGLQRGLDARCRSACSDEPVQPVQLLSLKIALARRSPDGHRRQAEILATIAGARDPETERSGWERRSIGPGAHGERVYDWTAVTLDTDGLPDGWGHWQLVRRQTTPPESRTVRELAFYRCAGPATTPLTELVRVAGARWSIEEYFQAAKNEAGLDHYQVRSYRAWHAHITLAMLAAAYLAVTRATAHDREAEKGDLQPAAHG